MEIFALTYKRAHQVVLGAGKRERAEISQRFFKTGPGEYGEGDVFCGLTVPQTRELAKKFGELPFSEIKKLLSSEIHEERLLALLILVRRFERGESAVRKKIYDFYLQNTARVNNWDLVDLSADKIVGRHLLNRSIAPLLTLARSKILWERRVAIVSTFQFIRQANFRTTFKIVRVLISDGHDLIHKACGWMLREVGKRDSRILRDFLKLHSKSMPRTMLRYAIERFSKTERKKYLAGLA